MFRLIIEPEFNKQNNNKGKEQVNIYLSSLRVTDLSKAADSTGYFVL